ncbi:hypothetical protein BDB13_6109 [Rhodococcus sp. OK302]|nr:hypothetical protein BDB13_6109 [Rhodococcus sp. OK302]
MFLFGTLRVRILHASLTLIASHHHDRVPRRQGWTPNHLPAAADAVSVIYRDATVRHPGSPGSDFGHLLEDLEPNPGRGSDAVLPWMRRVSHEGQLGMASGSLCCVLNADDVGGTLTLSIARVGAPPSIRARHLPGNRINFEVRRRSACRGVYRGWPARPAGVRRGWAIPTVSKRKIDARTHPVQRADRASFRLEPAGSTNDKMPRPCDEIALCPPDRNGCSQRSDR